jgi:hypothetical protein
LKSCVPFSATRDSLSRARTLRLRVEISAEDAPPEVLLGCSPLCARFSEVALTKAIVVALTVSGSS